MKKLMQTSSEVLRQSEAETIPELEVLIPDSYQVKWLLTVKSWLELIKII